MESKKEYLRRILKVTRDDAWYSEMDTFMREYNNFISAFNFEEIRDGEIEKIFVDFHAKGITPARLVELQKGKEELKKQLFYYSKKTKEYYETEIKGKRYEEICRTNRAKEIQIELMDLERNHSLMGNLKDLSEGGTHDRSNLISLCRSCHARIHAERGDRWHGRKSDSYE